MVSGFAVRSHVQWPKTFRIIRSIHPPIDLFEDIADPRDWEALVAVEAKTNPRVRHEVGDLGKVPADRRISGPGASFIMAPFVHCSTTRPGRFTDGSYGIYYAGDHQKFMSSTRQAPGWTSDFRVLIGSTDRTLDDVNAVPDVLHPDDYTASRTEGRGLRAAGSDGLLWDSVRMPGQRCIGIFWPDVVTIPIQGRHYCYHWNGTRVDFVRQYDTGAVLAVT
jgi:hypothetical protein